MEWLQLSFAGLLKIASKLMFGMFFANEEAPGKMTQVNLMKV